MRAKVIALITVAALVVLYVLLKPAKEFELPSEKQVSSNLPIPVSEDDNLPSRAETLLKRRVSSDPNLDHRIIRYTDGSVDLKASTKTSSKLHQSKDPRKDLEIVSLILSNYRSLFKVNPVGVENFEFTDALTGDNPKRVNFLDPNSSALSGENELIDRWGSPIVFHPISGSVMELRSLGPDKILWTDDDIFLDQ